MYIIVLLNGKLAKNSIDPVLFFCITTKKKHHLFRFTDVSMSMPAKKHYAGTGIQMHISA